MRRVALAMLLAVPGFAGLAGCEGELKVPTVADVKQAMTNTVEGVKQTTGSAGNVELQLPAPVKTTGCYAAIYPQSAGRQNVLEITSYNDPSAESFPSFFFHAQVTQRTAGELSGQKVLGQVFVMEKTDGPLWQCPADQPAQLSITAIDDSSVTADLQCVLVNAASGERKDVTGKISGSMKK